MPAPPRDPDYCYLPRKVVESFLPSMSIDECKLLPVLAALEVQTISTQTSKTVLGTLSGCKRKVIPKVMDRFQQLGFLTWSEISDDQIEYILKWWDNDNDRPISFPRSIL